MHKSLIMCLFPQEHVNECFKYICHFLNWLSRKAAQTFRGFDFAASKILSFLAVSIITLVLILLGVIALVIPGIVLAIIFSLVLLTIVIEDTGALENLLRSRRLVSNRWLKTFRQLLLLYIVIGVATVISGLINRPFGLGSGLVGGIITAFIQPILP